MLHISISQRAQLLFLLAGTVLFLLPTATQAYFTTDQTATSLNEQTTLYTITYKFGHGDYDIYMPIMIERDLGHAGSQSIVGYEILEESRSATTTGTATGIVLSTAEIVDGMYKIPAGTSAEFTLFALFDVEISEEETDYALRMTNLPFYFDTLTDPLYLNPSELQYYITPEAEMNPD